MNAILRNTRRRTAATALIVWGLSFALYYVTLAPTIVWGDPAKLTNQAYLDYLRLYTANHALHNLVGHYWGLLPFADYSFGQNLLSAVFASLAVVVLFFIVNRLTGSAFASVAAALSLAVAHTFWWLAVIDESYSMAFFFFVLAMLAEIMWLQSKRSAWLYLTYFALGLGISDHFILVLLAPAFVTATLIGNPRVIFDLKKISGVIIAFVLGAGLLVYIYFTQRPPLTWTYMVEPTDIESIPKMLGELLRFPAYVFVEFPLAGFGLGVLGLYHARKAGVGVSSLLLVAFLIDYAFSALYMWQRQPEMMAFAFVVFALWVGLGAHAAWQWLTLRTPSARLAICAVLLLLILLVPPATYYAAPLLAKTRGGNVLGVRALPYRDNDHYFLSPDKRNETGARQFAEEVFAEVPYGSIVVADFTPYVVLQYLQLVENKRPDVLLVYPTPGPRNPMYNGLVEANIDKVPIYLVDIKDYKEQYGIEHLSQKYKFERAGSIYRLLRK